MNKAALKYAKIIASEGAFNVSSNSIQQDIVAMIATMKTVKPKPTTKHSKQQQSSKEGNPLKHKYHYVNDKQVLHQNRGHKNTQQEKILSL